MKCGTSLFGKSSEIESFRTVPGSLWKIGTLPISRQVGSSNDMRMLGESYDFRIESWVRNEDREYLK